MAPFHFWPPLRSGQWSRQRYAAAAAPALWTSNGRWVPELWQWLEIRPLIVYYGMVAVCLYSAFSVPDSIYGIVAGVCHIVRVWWAPGCMPLTARASLHFAGPGRGWTIVRNRREAVAVVVLHLLAETLFTWFWFTIFISLFIMSVYWNNFG